MDVRRDGCAHARLPARPDRVGVQARSGATRAHCERDIRRHVSRGGRRRPSCRPIRPARRVQRHARDLLDWKRVVGPSADVRDAARGPHRRGPRARRRTTGRRDARVGALAAFSARPDDRAARIVLGVGHDPRRGRGDHDPARVRMALGVRGRRTPRALRCVPPPCASRVTALPGRAWSRARGRRGRPPHRARGRRRTAHAGTGDRARPCREDKSQRAPEPPVRKADGDALDPVVWRGPHVLRDVPLDPVTPRDSRV